MLRCISLRTRRPRHCAKTSHLPAMHDATMHFATKAPTTTRCSCCVRSCCRRLLLSLVTSRRPKHITAVSRQLISLIDKCQTSTSPNRTKPNGINTVVTHRQKNKACPYHISYTGTYILTKKSNIPNTHVISSPPPPRSLGDGPGDFSGHANGNGNIIQNANRNKRDFGNLCRFRSRIATTRYYNTVLRK